MRSFASKVNFKLLLDKHVIKERIKNGNQEKKIASRDINESPEFGVLYPAYDFIYGKYDECVDYEIYSKENGGLNPFTKLVRLKLLFYILEAPKVSGGCGITVSKYLSKDYITAMFPTPDEAIAQQLLEDTTDYRVLPWAFPFDRMKEYFGEKFTLFYQ